MGGHISLYLNLLVSTCRYVFEDQIDFIKESVMDGEKVCRRKPRASLCYKFTFFEHLVLISDIKFYLM